VNIHFWKEIAVMRRIFLAEADCESDRTEGSRLRREIIQKLDLKIIQKFFLCGAPNGAPVLRAEINQE